MGAGIVGAAIAYYLARRDADVTVIEAHRPGSGASSHSFAWINATNKSPAFYHDFNRRSLEMWDRFAQQLGANVGLRWGGELRWASTASTAEALKEHVQRLQSWGYPTRLIKESGLSELEPSISPGVVSAAAFTELDGQVEPQMVVDACLGQAAEMGASVLLDAEVTGFSLAPDGEGLRRVGTVHTTKGDVGCDVVVLAAGVETTHLAAQAGIVVPQQSSPGVVVRTTPLRPVLRTAVVVHTPPMSVDRPEIHLRQAADGTVIIGEGT